jgi:thiamine-monophosphate kinase
MSVRVAANPLYLSRLITSEKSLIAAIRRLSGRGRNKAVIRGIGDDCAVLRLFPDHELLVTTDFSIENVHFRRKWHPARSVGHRCLARGLSDIAAMGGEPLACFLSLGLPPKLPQRWVDGFLQGLHRLAQTSGVQLAGGDTSAAPQITADIIVTGQVPRAQAILRSGARPGDRIFVTGELGHSTAVLNRLFAGKRIRPSVSDRHFFPLPRLRVGAWLRARRLVTAMIDLSDGLSVDLAHICEESRVSAVIKPSQLPVARDASLDLALHGGEDYELLFTASAKAKIPKSVSGVKITEIGRITRQKHYPPAIPVLDENGRERPLPPLAWQHFRR